MKQLYRWIGMAALVVITLTACAPDRRIAANKDADETPVEANIPAGQGPPYDWLAGAQRRADGALRLTDSERRISNQNAAFSPDGATILFTRWQRGYNEGPSGIYLLNLMTGETATLSFVDDQDTVNLPGTSWNSASERIAFSSDRSGIDEIWTVNSDGSDARQVTHHNSQQHWIEPTFSPDGEWLVFEMNNDPYDVPSSLWIVRADGGALSPLIDDPLLDTRQPNWSPLGHRILFQGHAPASDYWNLYTINRDGSALLQISFRGDDTDASWSSDGNWIVYSSIFGELDTASLFVLPAKGGDPFRVTFDDAQYDGAPSWSPDGAWIVFESYPGDEDNPSALWIIAAPELDG